MTVKPGVCVGQLRDVIENWRVFANPLNDVNDDDLLDVGDLIIVGDGVQDTSGYVTYILTCFGVRMAYTIELEKFTGLV